VGVGTRRDFFVQLRASIGNALVVPAAPGPAFPDEPLQVRERLRHRKAPLRGAQLRPEETEGDLVRAARLLREHGRRLLEPCAVVSDQLTGSAGGIRDRFAVPGIDDAGCELDRPLERREVVAERIRPALRVEPDRRRDLLQQMVTADEDAVAQEADMPVGVTRQLDDVPPTDMAPLVQQLGVECVADEGREGVAFLDQPFRDVGRRAMTDEPRGHALRPVLTPPDALTLRVVEAALEDGRAGDANGSLRTADVVGVKVRDRDAFDGDAAPRRVAEPEPGVEEGPVCEVAVDVLRAGREGQGEALDPLRELYERVFYTSCSAMRIEYREEPCRSALNPVKGMGFKWSLNPYMGCVHRCTFCYVRAFEKRSDRPADDRYGTSIRVKTNVAEVLRRELARSTWEREQVTIGAATDPYQPAEGRYKLTRACLEVLRDASNPFAIITRGPMIVRDLDVLVEAAQRADVGVTFSIPTLDEDVWKKTEPSTAHPRQRLRAVKALVDAGVKAGVGMAPILPGVSDRPEQLREVVRAAREAGATGIWANLLFLRPGTREHFLEHLAEDWPEQLPLYERLYAHRRAYLGAEERNPLRSEVSKLAREHGIRDRRKIRLAPPPEPEQLSLTL
jgi:DNA repair photolyase